MGAKTSIFVFLVFLMHLYCNYCYCILQLYTPFSSPHFREDFDNKFLICKACVDSIAIDRDSQWVGEGECNRLYDDNKLF